MRNKKKGFSLIELLIVVAIILIIAAIAIPNLLRARITANETSAVGSMRTINTACVQYASTYGIGFPAALANLAPGATVSSTSADLIDTVLASASKSGYNFSYTPGTASAAGTIDSYTMTADPVTPGTTGGRYFFTDASGVIRQSTTGTATSADPPIS